MQDFLDKAKKEFEEAGSGKSAGSLKFALSFNNSFTQENTNTTGNTEKFLTRPPMGAGDWLG